ncbi:hypothetical protein D3C72_2327570 [compost metagenome]
MIRPFWLLSSVVPERLTAWFAPSRPLRLFTAPLAARLRFCPAMIRPATLSSAATLRQAAAWLENSPPLLSR